MLLGFEMSCRLAVVGYGQLSTQTSQTTLDISGTPWAFAQRHSRLVKPFLKEFQGVNCPEERQ